MTTLYPPDLPIGVYRVTLVALEPVELSAFSAATLRGAFGWSFKRMVCYQPQVKTCRGCLLRGQCPYPQVFEPPPPPDSIYAGQQQTVPPYVLRRPLVAPLAPPAANPVEAKGGANGPQRYAPGESFAFEIVLAGWANGMIPYFALALQQLETQGVGRGRGQVRVQRIEALAPEGSGQWDSGTVDSGTVDGGTGDSGPSDRAIVLFDAEQPDQIANHGGFPAQAWIRDTPAPAQITVNFVSPTRLQSEGRVQGEPDFHVFYRALLRRVSALCTVHTDMPWETDFAALADAAQGVATVAAATHLERRQRRSDRQGAMEFWGTEGIMVYRGDLTPFWPLLQLGQVIHVGKNCTFGLGRYVVL